MVAGSSLSYCTTWPQGYCSTRIFPQCRLTVHVEQAAETASHPLALPLRVGSRSDEVALQDTTWSKVIDAHPGCPTLGILEMTHGLVG